MSESTYGLVLSGGGVRAMAHIGVIKALEEVDLSPTYVSGASAGAIVGAFYAAGFSCEEMMTFFRDTRMFTIDKYVHRKPGLLDTDKFYKIFKTYLPEDRFEALTKKLFVSATDILAGTTKLFHNGPLIHAVLASSAFPAVLSPILIDGVLYADGGITNNFPVEPLITRCDKIIGVFVNPLQKINAEELTSSVSVLDRAFKIGMSSMSIKKFNKCDLVIAPKKLSRLGTFNMSHLDEAYQIGYEAAKSQLDQVQNLTKA